MFRDAHPNNLAAGINAFLGPGGDSESLIKAFRANGTAVTPCLSTFVDAVAYANQRPDARSNYQYVAQSQRISLRSIPPSELEEFREMIPQLQKTVAKLQGAGVTILAGTDIAGDRVPGFSLQDELKAPASSGLTPLQVLQTATLNPAKVMGRTADYGAVAEGKVADLLLLDGDPTKDIAALQHIRAVILHGRLLSRSALDDQLRLATQLADRN